MIYADNAATTKLSEKALGAMLPFLQEDYGNASNSYSFGVKAKRALESARLQVAEGIGASRDEILFTSGGSESNSWALSAIESGHIITTSFEHHSVLNACHALERHGVRVTYLPVNSSGVVSVKDIGNALRADTKLVSVMFANNEIGTIQPIAEIGRLLKDKNILFHTDAVQAVGHVAIDVTALGIDLLSASAHKFNGPKGTGILFVKKGLELPSLIFGGKQEHGLRGGTENIAGIVGAATALIESHASIEASSVELNHLTAEAFLIIQKAIPNATVHGQGVERLPGVMNIELQGVSGEAIMNLLDLKGICVSTGSACAAGQNIPSHVLKAIALTESRALSSIRISFGRYNTKQEAITVADAIVAAYQKITVAESS
jgi:cysteine desulfurase